MVFRILSILILLSSFTNSVIAEQNEWVASTAGNWSEAANWSLKRLPSFEDNVIISEAKGRITVDCSTEIGSLKVDKSSISITDAFSCGKLTLVDAKIEIIDNAKLSITKSFQANHGSTVTGGNNPIIFNATNSINIESGCQLPSIHTIGTETVTIKGDSISIRETARFDAPAELLCQGIFHGGLVAGKIISEQQLKHLVKKQLSIYESENCNIETTGETLVEIQESNICSLICNNNSDILLQGNLSIENDCHISNKVNSFDLTSFNLSSQNRGTLQIDSTAKLIIRDINPSGFEEYRLSPYSKIIYKNTSPQTILDNTVFGNLEINSNSTISAPENICIKGSFTLLSGTFNASNIETLEIGKFFRLKENTQFINPPKTLIFNGTVSTDQEIEISSKCKYLLNGLTISSASTVYQELDSLRINGNLEIKKGTFSTKGNNIFIGGDLTNTKGRFTRSGHFHFESKRDSITIKASNKSKFMNLSINSPNCVITATDSIAVQQDFILADGHLISNGMFLQFCTTDNKRLEIEGELTVNKGTRLEIGNGTDLLVTEKGKLNICGSQRKPIIFDCNESDKYYSISINGKLSAQHYIFNRLSEQGLRLSKTALVDEQKNLSNGSFKGFADDGCILTINCNQQLTGKKAIKYVNFESSKHKGYTVKRDATISQTIEFYYARGRIAGNTNCFNPGNNIIWTGSNQLLWKEDAKSSEWDNARNWHSTSGKEQAPNDSCILYIQPSPKAPELGKANKCLGLIVDNGATVNIKTDSILNIKDSVIWGGTLFIGKNQSLKLYTQSDFYIENGSLFHNNGRFLTNFSSSKDSCRIVNKAKQNQFCFDNVSFEGTATYTIKGANKFTGDFESKVDLIFKDTEEITVEGNWLNYGTISNQQPISLLWKPTKNALITDKSQMLGKLTVKGNYECSTTDSLFINGDCIVDNNNKFNHSKPIFIKGDFINQKSEIHSSSEITFIGDSKQTIELTAEDKISSLKLNCTELELLSDIRIEDKITFTSGKISSIDKSVYLSTDCQTESSGNSWAECQLVKTCKSESMFPLGSAGIYAPIKIKPTTDSEAKYSVRFTSSAPQDTLSRSATLYDFCDAGNWFIEQLSGEAKPLVGIKMTIDNWNQYNTVAHYESSKWEDMGGYVDDDNFIWSTSPFESFSPAGATKSTNALPAELSDIWVDEQASGFLYWETASEHQLSHFEIEISADGQNFTKTGIITAHGNSSTNQKYKFPLSGIDYSFIRIKCVDNNGEYEYSKTLSLSAGSGSEKNIAPNPLPFSTRLQVRHPKIKSIQINNKLGQVVGLYSYTEGLNSISFKTGLPRGIYIVTVYGEFSTSSHKLLIK